MSCLKRHSLSRFVWVLMTLVVLSASGVAQEVAPNVPPKPHPEVQVLLDKGRASQAASPARTEEALRLLNEALVKSRALQDKRGEAHSLSIIGDVYLRTGQPQKALGLFQQALPLHQQLGDDRGTEAWALYGIGEAYRILGESQKALDMYQQALSTHRQASSKVGEAWALYNIGEVYRNTRRREKALPFYQQALPLFRQAGDRGGEEYSLSRIGDFYRETGQHEKALSFYRQAGDKGGGAWALTSMGDFYSETGQFAKALPFYQQALALFRQAGDKEAEATLLIRIGDAYRLLGKREKALPFYEQALTLNRQVIEKLSGALLDKGEALQAASSARTEEALRVLNEALEKARMQGDKTGESRALLDIGNLYSRISQPLKGLPFYEQALVIYRQAGSKSGEANALRSIGMVYFSAGQIPKALESFDQAVSLNRQAGNKAGEADALLNIGNIFSNTGQPQKTLNTYQQVLTLRRQAGDKVGEANTLNNIGIFYLTTGQTQQAIQFYEKALTLYRQAGEKSREANLLINMGIAYGRVYDWVKHRDLYEQALTLFRQTGDKSGEARAIASIGNLQRGEPPKALESFRQALTLHRQLGDKVGEASVLSDVGSVYYANGLPDRALQFYEQALLLRRQIGDTTGEAGVLASIALARKKGTRSLAEDEVAFRDALAILEKGRDDLGGLSEAKVSYLASVIYTYRAYIHVLLRRNKPAEAFAVVQQIKARALLDLMASGRVDIQKQMTAAEKQQERQLRARADQLNAQMVREGVENEVGAKKRFEALKTRLGRAESDLQVFTDTLFVRHPELARKRAAKTATLADVARYLPQDTALLEYIVMRVNDLREAEVLDATVLFVVTNNAGKAVVKAYRLPVMADALPGKAAALRAACADPRKPYKALAQEMHGLLLPPAAVRYLSEKKRLVICPDGALWDVPFAALHDGKQFLLERYELAFAYSATGAQATLMERRKGQTPLKPTAGTLLALANPDFGGEKRFGDNPPVPGQRPIDAPSRPIDAPSRPIDAPSRPIDAPSRPIDAPSRELMVPRGGRIVALPGTQREADMLRNRFARSASIYTGPRAQEGRMKKDAGRYRYLHLASHAFFNDAAPLLSSVVLASPTRGSGEDGFLTAREIFDMNLSGTNMVVLSACNTARGEQRSGEGIVGLTWALFVAGVPTQVLSQWAVDDASTATLMGNLYRGLTQGGQAKQAKGAALRTAALSLRKNRKYAHPYYWAPFVLMGDWRK